MGYLANFMVYTLAMVGVIVVALLVFKNATFQGGGGKSKYLKIIDTMSLAPRKTLYIVSTGREKFLIAGDSDKTTLISRLENNVEPAVFEQSKLVSSPKVKEEIDFSQPTFSQTMTGLAKSDYMDKSIGINSSILSKKSETPYNSVIRNLAEKMRG